MTGFMKGSEVSAKLEIWVGPGSHGLECFGAFLGFQALDLNWRN